MIGRDDSPGRPRSAVRPDWTGQRFVTDIGAVAHGGHCVARHEGRVVFVRHCLPGERVQVLVTEDHGGSFCRADAIEVLRAAPGRRVAPCRYAGPGGCGGCDFQHVDVDTQRELKSVVVAEQLERLAGIRLAVRVEQVPGDLDGLRWRRRIRYATSPDGRLGLRRHRSRHVVPINECLIGAPGVGDSELLARRHSRYADGDCEVEIATDDAGDVAVTEHWPKPVARRRQPDRGRSGLTVTRHASGALDLHYLVAGNPFRVTAGGFWQTHPGAAVVFTDAVLHGCQVRQGDRILDLYAGAGMLSLPLALATGGSGALLAIEGGKAAASDARFNLAGLAQAQVAQRPVTAATVAEAGRALGRVDLVILDPPRVGAWVEVMSAVLSIRPRRVVYVACDPAALARDLRAGLDAGWRLIDVRAFDTFPMTHHVECVATLSA
jgi:tRNA/tmRNA/rRNA uracil-C5-methylase (TrmA/RlmC/RlmD family)